MGQENENETSEIGHRALSVLRSGDVAAADRLRSEALSLLDDSSPLLHCVIAVFHLKSGLLLDAIASARQAVAISTSSSSSSHIDSSLFYARLLFHEGRIHDATTELHRALLVLCDSVNLTPQRQDDEEKEVVEEAAQCNVVVSPRKQEARSGHAAVVETIPGLTRYTRKKLKKLTITQQQQKEGEETKEKLKEESGAQRNEAQVKAQVREFLEYQIKTKQLQFLTVDIDEFKTLLTDPATEKAANQILEALEIPGNSFTFLLCFSCGAKFVDFDSFINHLNITHFPVRESDVDPDAIPDFLDRSTADEIASSRTWKPVDIKDTLKVLNKFPNTSDPIQLSRDTQRISSLRNVGESLRELMYSQCLSPLHVSTVARSATYDIDPRLLTYVGGEESPRCVCFASTARLRHILRYIMCLWEAYEVSKGSAADDSYPSENGEDEAVSEGCPYVFRDEKSVLLDLKSLSTIFSGQQEEEVDVDAVVEWLYSVSRKTNTIPAAFLEWTSLKDRRRNLGVKFLVSLYKLLKLLKGDCEKKMERERRWIASGAPLHISEDLEAIEREICSNIGTMTAEDLEAKHQRLPLVVELGMLDVKISLQLSRVQLLKDHIVRASSLDYLPIVLPALRMLLQAKIQADAQQYAGKKSVENASCQHKH